MKTSRQFRHDIGYMAIIGGFVLVVLAMFVPIPDKSSNAVWGFIGLILGWGACVYQYEFGSSSGGRALALKQAAINEDKDPLE